MKKGSPATGIGGKLSIIGRLRIFPRYLRDPEVILWRKGVMLLLVAYILSPVDAIPELFLPFIGWLDDIGALGLLTAWFYREMGKYAEEKKRRQ